MNPRLIFSIFFSGLIFGCNTNSQKNRQGIASSKFDSISIEQVDTLQTIDADYKLSDLSPALTTHIEDQLKIAEELITKYNGTLPKDKYNARLLDYVFLKWMNSNEANKESPEFFVEAMGTAFGQDIVNTLNCEWKILTDQNGSDLTVINKKYKVNGFPLSSAEKAYTEKRKGSFETIKFLLQNKIAEAEKTNKINNR
jgi:Domain of unknown function (DUF3806)